MTIIYSNVVQITVEPGSSQYDLHVLVEDNSSGTSIAGATVTIKQTGDSLTTNSLGYVDFSLPPGYYTVDVSATGYSSNSQNVNLQGNMSITIYLTAVGGGGGGGTLQAKFQISSSWSLDMPVSLIHYVSSINPFLNCYYVSDYFQDNPCCGSKPSGYAFTITGKIVDTVGNPVPNQPYLIYLLNLDPNIRIIDYVTGNNAINPSQSNPINAKSDSNGNMNLGIVYYKYPYPDQNSNNYPPTKTGGGCSIGNVIPEFAVSDNIVFQISGTAIQGQTVISITWEKHYLTLFNLWATSCPKQSNSCLG